MTIRQYPTTIKVLLKPIWFNRAPTGKIGINGLLEKFSLDQERWFEYDVTDHHGTEVMLTVEHYGKTNQDSDLVGNRDTAIVVDQIVLNNIFNPKFVGEGIYTPQYPQHYQIQNPDMPASLKHYTYLGWNGIWTLNLTLPIYTWIHKVEDLGWIYN